MRADVKAQRVVKSFGRGGLAEMELCVCGHPKEEHVEESSECRHDAEERQGCPCAKFERTPKTCGERR